jgi:flagellar hook-basal body complex protein FliE
MTVVPLDRLPLAGLELDGPPAPVASPDAFARALSDAAGAATSALERADTAERAFVAHRGGLSEMVVERAQADVVLSLASAATSRIVQSLSTILGMQV